MTDRLLLCVDGSPAALGAARLAIEMVGRHGGRILAVFVAAPPGEDGVGGAHPESEGRSILVHVETMARDEGAEIEVVLTHGDPLRMIMDEAARWRPDLILMGRGRRSGPGSPIVGSLTAHMLEFSRWPVVVVPAEAQPRP